MTRSVGLPKRRWTPVLAGDSTPLERCYVDVELLDMTHVPTLSTRLVGTCIRAQHHARLKHG